MSLFDALVIQEYIQPPAQTSVAAIPLGLRFKIGRVSLRA